jgi:hypothetical protein
MDEAGNISDWSSPRIFYVNTGTVTLTSPTDNCVLSVQSGTDIQYSWQPVTGFKYAFNLFEGGTQILTQVIVNEGSYTPSLTYVEGETYQWNVQLHDGDTGYGTASSTWTFTIDNTPPGVPTIIGPSGGDTITDSTPTLSWNAVADASTYDVQVSTSNTFSSTAYAASDLSGTSHTIPAGSALANGTYYWRVQAVDAASNESGWSATASFVVNVPAAPVLQAPTNGSSTTDTTPTFTWGAVTGVDDYILQYSTSESFTSPTSVTVGTTTYTPPSAMALGTYYWRVKATLTSGGETAYSTAWSLTIQDQSSVQIAITVAVKSGSTGDVISGATVRLSQGTTVVGQVQTGTTGTAGFSVPAGSYSLQVTKNLWDNGSGSSYVQGITVNASTTSFPVLLYEEGTDLIIATIRYNDKNGTVPSSVVILRDGVTYLTIPSLPRIPPGVLPASLMNARTNLVVSVPETGLYSIADPGDLTNAATVTNLSKSLASPYNNDIVLNVTSSVMGLVVDEQGTIITDATVWLLRPELDGTSSIIGVPLSSTTIGFTFLNILPDSYVIKVTKPGYADKTTSPFTVVANEAKNVGMIVLTQEKSTLNVTVKDEENELLRNAQVVVRNASGTMVFSQTASQGIVGTEIIPGTYTVTATLSGYEQVAPVSVTVTLDNPASVTVVLAEAEPPPPETGSVEITILDADGAPLQLVEVFINGTKVGVTNQEGVLLLEDLDPGDYSFTFVKEGYVEATATVEVIEGEEVTASPTMEILPPPEEGGSWTKWILLAVVLIVVAGAALFIMAKRKAGGDEEMPFVAESTRPAAGPRSMPAEKLSEPREERAPRPSALPRTSADQPQVEDRTSGIPSASKREQGGIPGKRSGSGLPGSSIRDE